MIPKLQCFDNICISLHIINYDFTISAYSIRTALISGEAVLLNTLRCYKTIFLNIIITFQSEQFLEELRDICSTDISKQHSAGTLQTDFKQAV